MRHVNFSKLKNGIVSPGKATDNELLVKLRKQFDEVQNSPDSAKRELIKKMAAAWFSGFPEEVLRHYSPVLVMRGALLFYESALASFLQPIGFLLPPRPKRTGGSLDIPTLSKNQGYLILDLIANTGKTTVFALDLFKIHVDGADITYAVLFATKESLLLIKEKYPDVSILVGFDDFERGPNGWLKGINFDAGDLATNGPKPYEQIPHVTLEL